MPWLAVGHSVSAVPLQSPFCRHHPFLSQVSLAVSSFPFTTNSAPAPGRHASVRPSEVSQAPVIAGFAPVLPSASPREALPMAPVPSGSAPVRPSAPLAGAFPLAPAGVPLCTPPLPRSLFPFSLIIQAHSLRCPLPCPETMPCLRPPAFRRILLPLPVPRPQPWRPRTLCGGNLCRFVQLFFHCFQSVAVDHSGGMFYGWTCASPAPSSCY